MFWLFSGFGYFGSVPVRSSVSGFFAHAYFSSWLKTKLCIMFFFVQSLVVENGKFLLSAKRTRRTTRTEYIISMDADNISRSSNSYLGKLRFVLISLK